MPTNHFFVLDFHYLHQNEHMHSHDNRGVRVRSSGQVLWAFGGSLPSSVASLKVIQHLYCYQQSSLYGLQPGLELETLPVLAQSRTDWATAPFVTS